MLILVEHWRPQSSICLIKDLLCLEGFPTTVMDKYNRCCDSKELSLFKDGEVSVLVTSERCVLHSEASHLMHPHSTSMRDFHHARSDENASDNQSLRPPPLFPSLSCILSFHPSLVSSLGMSSAALQGVRLTTDDDVFCFFLQKRKLALFYTKGRAATGRA